MNQSPASTTATDRTTDRRPRRRTAALALTLTTALGASVLPLGAASASTDPIAPAPAPDNFAGLAAGALWDLIDEAGGRAVVGLKDDDEAHGFVRGRSLVDAAERAEAEAAVRAITGVEVVSSDDRRPALTLRITDVDAVGALRSSDHVEYLEPTAFEAEVLGSGCTGNDWNADPEGGDVSKAGADLAPGGDLVPKNFATSRIQEAWGRSPGGANVTIGVMDTGVFAEQLQLRPAVGGGRFDVGMSARRTVKHLDTSETGKLFDTCNHGTRSAGSIAGPRDGQSLAGVAYRANLVTAKVNEDVAIDAWETDDLVRGIRAAVDSGSRVISMAIGTGSMPYDNIKHEIQDHYYNRGVLFLAAAGTLHCAEGVLFPAKMSEVVAVTGTDPTGRLHPDACRGPEVEIAANISSAAAPGRRNGDIITWGGSSAATSVAAGTAALIWSKYPSMTRNDVRQRLVWAGKGAVEAGLGAGIVDAYKAVGGLHSLTVSGGGTVAPGTTRTLTAKPLGDGPYTYQWSNGATSPSITVTAGASGTSQTFTVNVRDSVDGRIHAKTVTLHSQTPEPLDEPICTNWRYC